LAVEALEAVRRSIPNVQLRVYGRQTPFSQKVMNGVQARGLQDAVHYHGAKSLEQIAQAIDDCDLGIIPNRRSLFTELNLPTRIFEYLAWGKGVIAPRTAGIQDYFGEEEIIFFNLGDADDLGRKMEYAVSHPREVDQIVLRGQAVYRRHCWSQERSRFVALVSQLLSGARIS
jgi:glycosyltransferase involved in cell wall biosynthesis